MQYKINMEVPLPEWQYKVSADLFLSITGEIYFRNNHNKSLEIILRTYSN